MSATDERRTPSRGRCSCQRGSQSERYYDCTSPFLCSRNHAIRKEFVLRADPHPREEGRFALTQAGRDDHDRLSPARSCPILFEVFGQLAPYFGCR